MELFDFKTADILPSYLIFDPKTGKIERLTGQKQNENCLEITNDKYKEISNSSLLDIEKNSIQQQQFMKWLAIIKMMTANF